MMLSGIAPPAMRAHAVMTVFGHADTTTDVITVCGARNPVERKNLVSPECSADSPHAPATRQKPHL